VKITRTDGDGVIDLVVDGRLDGYWADHLESALTEIIRDGHHRIRLDCAGVSFLSSASIGILVKFHKQLEHIHGSFQVVNPSPRVSAVLQMTRLSALLVDGARTAGATSSREVKSREIEGDGVRFTIFDLDARATLTCHTLGTADPFSPGGFTNEACVSLESLSPVFAVGVGAFGESFADCGPRFGELLTAAGAAAYQPADGTNVPDYLLTTGALASDVQMLHGLACTGAFSHLVRFETIERGAATSLSSLLAACLDVANAEALGVVMIAEVAGLIGAALRRSPVSAHDGLDFFAHPEVRTRLSFTTEPAHAGGIALVAGTVTRSATRADAAHFRPLEDGTAGHLHAAAFRFRPIEKGAIDYRASVAGLFESGQLLGVLHLLSDDRGAAGAGDSQFVRGACWVGALT
jgi:anti-anti-sigma factor